MANEETWHAVHIFVSDVLRMETFLLRHIVPKIKELNRERAISNWFFIRYWEGGPHIRVRILTTPDIFRAFLDFIELNADDLRGTNRVSQEEYYAQLPSTLTEELTELTWYPEGSAAQIPYVPETRRYGGPSALPISEILFRISSEFAVKVISSPLDVNQRIAIALDLMLANALAIFDNSASIAEYFTEYSKQWRAFVTDDAERKALEFDAQPDSDRVLSRYDAPASSLRSGAKKTLGEHWMSHLVDTRKALAQLAESEALYSPETGALVKTSSDAVSAIASILASQMHMLNNRMGITPNLEFHLSLLIATSLGKNQK